MCTKPYIPQAESHGKKPLLSEPRIRYLESGVHLAVAVYTGRHLALLQLEFRSDHHLGVGAARVFQMQSSTPTNVSDPSLCHE